MNNQEANTIQILDKSLKKGFASVPRVVLRAKGLSRNAKCLYALLLDYAWQEGSCFPGQDRLAIDLDISVDTIRKDLNELKTFGLISWVQRGLNRTNIYYINDLSEVFSQLLEAVNPRLQETAETQLQEAEEPQHLIEEDLIDSDKYTQPISNIGDKKFSIKKQKIHTELFDSEAVFLSVELNDQEGLPFYQSVIKKRNNGEITQDQIQKALTLVKDKLAIDKADGKTFWKNPGAMFNKTLQQIIEKANSKQTQIEEISKKLTQDKKIQPEKSLHSKMNEDRNNLLNQLETLKNLETDESNEKEVNTS